MAEYTKLLDFFSKGASEMGQKLSFYKTFFLWFLLPAGEAAFHIWNCCMA